MEKTQHTKNNSVEEKIALVATNLSAAYTRALIHNPRNTVFLNMYAALEDFPALTAVTDMTQELKLYETAIQKYLEGRAEKEITWGRIMNIYANRHAIAKATGN